MTTNTHNTNLPHIKLWFCFFYFVCVVLVIILPMVVLIVINFGYNYWLDSNPITNLIFCLRLIYLNFGFLFLFFKMYEYWEHSFVVFQSVRYLALPPQKMITMELNIPTNYDYEPTSLMSFFYSIATLSSQLI